jgi:hypothetical protein
MNKLLQHMMDAGDIDHKFLPFLQKMQKGGNTVKVRNANGTVTEYDTRSPEYSKLYNQGIGRFMSYDKSNNKWTAARPEDPNAEFISSTKTLPEVVVTAKAKPNSLSGYSSAFYKQNPYEAFFRNRYNQIKGEFTSQPQWAQSSVGGWDRESRQENVKNQIGEEYQKQFNDYVGNKLLERSPQGNQSRDQWLSTKNFTPRELALITGRTQPNLWAQGAQGLYNIADMLAVGALPELAMPGIARSEVQNYNTPLSALSPLTIPAKMVQSTYKDNYSIGDALSGKVNNASIGEDIATDPLTYLSFGTKPLLTGASRIARFTKPYVNKTSSFLSKLGSKPGSSAVSDFAKGVEVVDPETGISKIMYTLDEGLPSAPKETDMWGIGQTKTNGIEITDEMAEGWGWGAGYTPGLTPKPFVAASNNPLSKVNIQEKIAAFKSMFPSFNNTNDYTRPLTTLEDYRRWGKTIHPELGYAVDPALIKDAHRKAIQYFKQSGQLKFIEDPGKEIGLFIRQELADKIPSFKSPVVTTPSGERFIYGQGMHPSVYSADEQTKYFDFVRNQLNDIGDARAIQEAQPLTEWGYDISKLTPEERSLMHAYARGYDEKINSTVRKNIPSQFFQGKAGELNAAIQKNKFPNPTQVRRGSGSYEVELLDPVTYKPTGVKKLREKLEQGDVFKDDGFASTSLDTDYNWGFFDASEVIDIPGGGVQSYGFPNSMSSTPYFTETEVILPKGLIRRVEEVREMNNVGKFPNNAKYRTKILNPYTFTLPMVGAAAMSQKKKGGPIVSPFGQWAYPGENTMVPTPTGQITMQDVPYPVYGQDETGYGQMMYPGGEYTFPGQMVNEIPMMAGGGQHGGLDRWFAEKWVDVKTGKACGRQEGDNRAYPACRPSRRVSSETPKTSSEMSPAEKAKFKRSKTSSQRINYNHKRN